MKSSIQAAESAAAAGASLPLSKTLPESAKPRACNPRLPTTQLPRGGGASARKPPPVQPLDAEKTKLPFDPVPQPQPPKAKAPPPPPPPGIRMAKERRGAMPLAEKLDPGDVDFGKVRCALVFGVAKWFAKLGTGGGCSSRCLLARSLPRALSQRFCPFPFSPNSCLWSTPFSSR